MKCFATLSRGLSFLAINRRTSLSICLAVITLSALLPVCAEGAYYRSKASGNWNAVGTWESSADLSTWVAATATPGSSDDVYLQVGFTVTLTQNESCNNFNISANATGTRLALGVNTLSIYGTLGNYSTAVNVFPVTYSSSLPSTVAWITSTTGKILILGNTRTLTVTGGWGAGNGGTASPNGFDLEINLNSLQTVTMSQSIKARSWNIVAGTVDAGILNISADNGTTGQGNITIGSSATVKSSCTGATKVFQRTASAKAGALTVNGLLQLSGAAPQIAVNSISFAGTVEYTRAGVQTLAILASTGASPDTYTNLKLSGTSAKTLAVSTTVNGTLTIAGSASLALSTFTLTYGGSAILEYAGSAAQTTANAEFPASSGPANVTINNTAGVTLHAARTISGTATITTGSLILDGSKTLGAGALATGSGSGLVYAFGSSVPPGTAPLQISGSANFTTTPTLTVSGSNLPANTYPLITWGSKSGTEPSSVTLPLRATGNVSTSGNTLNLVITGNTQPMSWATGAGTWDVNNSGNNVWKDSASASTYYLDGDQVQLEDSLSGTSPITVSLNSIATPANVTVNNSTKDYTISGSGAIAGSSGVTKSGAGTFTLTCANSTYTGVTSIKNGTMSLSNVVVATGKSGLGNATSPVVLGDTSTKGTLSYMGAAATYTRGFTINAGGGQVDTVNNTLTINTGNIDTSSGGQLTIGGAKNVTINSVVGSGSVPLIKTGAGTLTLSANNTYTGPTLVNGGTVAVTNDNGLGVVPGSFVAKQLELDGGKLVIPGCEWAANRGIWLGPEGANFAPSSGVLTNNTDISGPGALTLSGNSTMMALGGANTFTGGIYTVLGNGPIATSDSNLGAVPAAPTINLTASNGWGVVLTAYETFTTHANRTVDLASHTAAGIQIWVKTGKTLTIGGEITGGGLYLSPGSATAGGTNTRDWVEVKGTLELSPGNTYTNVTVINSGTLVISADSCLGTPWPEFLPNAITLGGNSAGDYTYNAILQATETVTLNANRGIKTLSPVNAIDVAATKILTVPGAVSGDGGLNKIGNGTLKLTGTNSYLGATDIAAGQLEVSPSLDYALDGAVTGAGTLKIGGSGKVTLKGANTYSGATTVDSGMLGGNGSPNSAITIGSAGGVAPGASIGILQASSMTVSAGSTYDWEVDNTAPTADYIKVTGTLTLPTGVANSVPVNVINVGGGSGTFDLVLFTFGSLVGDVDSLQINVGASGYDVTTAQLSGNAIIAHMKPIPEPALAGAALFALLLLRKRF